MDNISKKQVLNLINEIKRVIKANKHIKISQELKNSFKTLLKLIDNNQCGPYYAYIDLLAQFEEIIDQFNIGIRQVSEMFRDQFKQHYKNQGSEDEDDNDDNDDNNNVKNIDNNKINETPQVNNCLYNKIMNNFNSGLEKALATNNDELFNNIVKLMNNLSSRQTLSLSPTPSTLSTSSNNNYAKIPEWLEKLKCSINPKIKINNQESFNYAMAIAKTNSLNRNRATKIKENFN